MLRHRFNWKRLSLAGALAYEPDGSDAHLVFELRPDAYNDEMLIEFLSELNKLEQRAVLLIWNGLPAHRSHRMSDWIASQRHWLSVEPLPGYASEVNPIEQVWGNLKSKELANLCSDTIEKSPTSPQMACIASAVMRHSASHFCVTPACGYDQITPAISQRCVMCREFEVDGAEIRPHDHPERLVTTACIPLTVLLVSA